MKAIAVIGCGKLACSLVRGWLCSDSDINVVLTARRNETIEKLKKEFLSPPSSHLSVTNNNCEAIKMISSHDSCELCAVILAVKPVVMGEVIEEIRGELDQIPEASRLVISLAAKVSISDIENSLRVSNRSVAVIRVITNTAAQYGMASTVLIANSKVTSVQKEQVIALFSRVGQVIWASEEDNAGALTTLLSSSPAFYYQLLLNVVRKYSEKEVLAVFYQVKAKVAEFLKSHPRCSFSEVMNFLAMNAASEPVLTQQFAIAIQNAFNATLSAYQGLDKKNKLESMFVCEADKNNDSYQANALKASFWFELMLVMLMTSKKQGVSDLVLAGLGLFIFVSCAEAVQKTLRDSKPSVPPLLDLITEIATKGGMTEAGLMQISKL